MSRSILVAYATKHGSTLEVAESIAGALRQRGLPVDLRPAEDVADVCRYDGVVLGAALYMGRPHPEARSFLRRHRRVLSTLPVAIFAMGPKSLEASDVAGSRAQLERALGKVPEIQPVAVAIFGGVVVPERLRFPFNRLPATDARDWSAIQAWADEVAVAFGAEPEPLPRDYSVVGDPIC